MPINSTREHTTVHVRNYTTVPLDVIKQEKTQLTKYSYTLLKNINEIKNIICDKIKSIEASETAISSYQSSLKSLEPFSEKKDAVVRLKGDHFKSGEASNFLKNMFFGSRYQTEREAAAREINAVGKTVSAGEVIKTLQTRVEDTMSKVGELQKEIAGYKEEYDDLKAQESPIKKNINELKKIVADAEKADKKNKQARSDFCMIYQSNAGCKGLNAEARYQFGNARSAGKVSASDVVEEYRRVHGYEIFGGGNKSLKSDISLHCNNLREVVKNGAKAWYTPTEKNMTTHRGQGMTQSGIDALISQFNADVKYKTETVYQPGQFFSTSADKNVASNFAERSQDNVKVLFKVIGNSGNGLFVGDGLSFDNKESELLYSPLANFIVTGVSRGSSNTYNVTLKEVPKVNKALILPY